MSASRYDNLSFDQLAEEKRALLEQVDALRAAMRIALDRELRDRFPIGRAFRVALDGFRLSGRVILIEGYTIEKDYLSRAMPDTPAVYGRVNLSSSLAGDGWSIRRQNVLPRRLAEEVPLDSVNRHHRTFRRSHASTS